MRRNSQLDTMSDRESERVGDTFGDDFAISEDFVSSPTHKRATTSRLDLDGLLQNQLSLHEDLAQGNGGQAWPAGYVLVKYLLRKKRDELKHSSMFVGRISYSGGILGWSTNESGLVWNWALVADWSRKAYPTKLFAVCLNEVVCDLTTLQARHCLGL